MTKLRDLKKRLMEDSEFREEYALADQEYASLERRMPHHTECGERGRCLDGTCRLSVSSEVDCRTTRSACGPRYRVSYID